ncbi:serine/threonine-protein kinase [Streptomyces sp. NRRL S-87]|uniref:serine/threonine-protein kinase n=1 Tax=Streptomyces sp. NRRL S-87 TaxID=1463920 RepID=UPI0004BE51EA|nr:serine/threonine-protein kinase [Streptomyces sp. NRRL S-87]
MKQIAGPGPATAGPYRLFAELGAGGMGRVLLGAGPDGRLVAVKQIHAEYADEDGFRARFRREVAASRKVSGACTAAVLDADPEAETPWLASVFVPGPALDQALEAGGPLSEEALRRLAAGLATALADIHRAGLVHRDLKPSNVLLAEDGVRVIDFGIARAVEGGTRITHTGSLIGSPAYMAPEQASGGAVTAATDVFALGSTLVAAATGHPPFAAESVPRLLYEILHAEPDLSGVPEGLRGLVGACLAKDPERRPTPDEVLAMVGTLAPAARAWPGVVAGLTAAQQAEVDALAATLRPTGGVTAGGGSAGAATGVGVGRRPRFPMKVRVLAVGAVLALVGFPYVNLGLTYVGKAYDRLTGDVPLSEQDDTFAGKAMTCQEIGGGFRAPAGFGAPSGDGIRRGDIGWTSGNRCVWTARGGEAAVEWELYLTGPRKGTGAEQAELAQVQPHGLDEPDLGFDGDGKWLTEGNASGATCVLSVREGNLRVLVEVRGDGYPAGAACESAAKEFARSALRVLPEA